MVKRQRDNTPPTSDDKDPQPKLVDYSDTESSDDEDDIRPQPRKRRAMTMYSDDEDDEDLTSYYTIKAVNEKKSRLFELKGKSFNSTSRLSLTMFRHINLYQDCLISWLKTSKKDARWNPMIRCV